MVDFWDPLRPELDTHPPRKEPPILAYVVCSTPRSGSGLLCRSLAGTGVAGLPAEYFNPRQRGPLARRWGCRQSPEAYARALVARRTAGNGVFGTKLHWNQLDLLSRELGRVQRPLTERETLRQLIPRPVFVHVLRFDVDAQAVSLWKAMYTGMWSRRHGEKPRRGNRVPYSRAAIEWCRQLVIEGEFHWQRLLAQEENTHVEVVYERLVEDHEREIRSVLEALFDARKISHATMPGAIPPPDSLRLADEQSGLLIERFRHDRRGRPSDPPLTPTVAMRRLKHPLGLVSRLRS